MPPTDVELDAIEQRWASATPGRWMWYGNSKGRDVYLAAVGVPGGVNIVMQPCRSGFNGASLRFAIDGIMQPAPLIRPEEHNPWKIRGIAHPDAIAIEHAPTDVATLLAEVKRLRRIEAGAKTVVAHCSEFLPEYPSALQESVDRLDAALRVDDAAD